MKLPSLFRFSLLLCLLLLFAPKTQAQTTEQNDRFFKLIQTGDVKKASALAAANPDLLRATDHAGNTPIHRAIFGVVPMVQWLLKQGADPSAKGFGDMTPLHLAAGYGSIKPEIFDALLAGGADINALDGMGYTPLHRAVAARKRDIAQLLLERGAKDAPPLFDAIAHQNLALVQQLIEADPQSVNKVASFSSTVDGRTLSGSLSNTLDPLHAAVFWGDIAIATTLLDNKAELEARDQYGETPLHEAVKLKNVALTRLLLDKGADVNAKAFARFHLRESENAMTPLHFAVQDGNREMVELLLARGADINAQTTLLKRTPLDWAAAHNQAALVALLREKGATWGAGNVGGGATLLRAIGQRQKELALALLEIGADANATSSSGQPALQLATRWGEAALVERLLQRGARVNATDKAGTTALHDSAKYGWSGDQATVSSLLLKGGTDVNARDKEGVTPLMLAVRHANMSLALKLWDKKADVNAADAQGNTALARALANSNIPDYQELANWLIDKGAKKDVKTALFQAVKVGNLEAIKRLITGEPKLLGARESRFSETPLDTAIRENQTEVAKLLLQLGADVRERDLGGATPLHMAANFGRTQIIDLLLNKGADINATNDEGETALHWMGASVAMASFLLQKGANVNARDKRNRTPLKSAFSHDRHAVAPSQQAVAALLAAGADINAKDEQGWTPLHEAAYMGWTEAGELLVKSGAGINAKDQQGWTPLRWARQMKHTATVTAIEKLGAHE